MKKNIVIAILALISLGLVGYIVYDKMNENEKENIEVEGNNTQLTTTEILNKFVGKYEYDDQIPGNGYHKLELLENGTYTYSEGMHNGGGQSAKGNYAIGNKKIYLYNDECNIELVGEECMYPNCTKIFELDYSELNDEINISVGNTTLEKK